MVQIQPFYESLEGAQKKTFDHLKGLSLGFQKIIKLTLLDQQN